MSDTYLLTIGVNDKGTPVIKNLRRHIKDTTDKSKKGVDKLAGSFGGLWKQMFAGQGVFAMVRRGLMLVTDQIKGITQSSSDAGEIWQKFSVIYAKNIDVANAIVKDLNTNWGLASSTAQDLLANTGDLLTGFGFSGKAALDMAAKVAKLGIDLASFTNFAGGSEGAVQALSAAMLGETERAKALNIVIRQGSKEYINLVKRGMEVEGLTQLQAKAMAAYTIALKQSKNAIGDWNRSSGSMANVQKEMGERIKEVQEKVGDAINKALLPILKSALDWFKKNKEEAMAFARKVGEGIADIITFIKDLVQFLLKWKDVIIAVGKALLVMLAVKKIRLFASSIKNLATSFSAGTKPIKGYAAALGAAVIMGELLSKAFKEMDEEIKKGIDWLQNHADQQKKVTNEVRSLQGELKISSAEMRGYTKEARDKGLTELGLFMYIRKAIKQRHGDELVQIKKTREQKKKAALEAMKAEIAAQNLKKKTIEMSKAEQKAISDLAAQYQVLTGKNLTDAFKKQDRMVNLWKQYGTEIKKDSEASKKFLDDLLALQRTLKDKMSPSAEELIIKLQVLHSKIIQLPKALNMKPTKIDLGINEWLKESNDWLKKNEEQSKKLNIAAKTHGEKWQEIHARYQMVVGVLNKINELFGFTDKNINKIAAGTGEILSGLSVVTSEKTDIFQKITGGVQMLIGALDILAGAWAAIFGDGVQEAIDRQNSWMKLTEEMNDKIYEMAEAMGDTHAATSKYYADIIGQAGVTVNNFDKWANRLKETFSDLDRGFFTKNEFMKVMGDGWGSLLSKAKELGTEGNRYMIEIIREMKKRGMEVKEIQEYIDSTLKAGYEARKDYTGKYGKMYDQAYFRAMREQGWDAMEIVKTMGANAPKDLRDFIQGNEATFKNIDASKRMMEGLGYTDNLNKDHFRKMQQEAMGYYKDLLKGGGSEKQALEAILPLLGKQAWFAEQNPNLKLDEGIRKLIESAREQGFNLEKYIPMDEKKLSFLEKQTDYQRELVDINRKMLFQGKGEGGNFYMPEDPAPKSNYHGPGGQTQGGPQSNDNRQYNNRRVTNNNYFQGATWQEMKENLLNNTDEVLIDLGIGDK